MIPHKSARGAAAIRRISLYEGVPPAQDKVKKMVVPAALRVLRLKPGRKYATLKRISHEVGWGYKDVVDRLEEKRKVKGQAYFERKVSAQYCTKLLELSLTSLQEAARKLRAKAAASAPANETLAKFGY